MRSAYIYFPIMSSFVEERNDVANISGDFIQMKKNLLAIKELGFKGVLLAPIFEAFEFMGISPYMPKSIGLETSLISPSWIYDKYSIYLDNFEDEDKRVLNYSSVWEKRRYIRELCEVLKKSSKDTDLSFEFSVYKKIKYDDLIYSALISEFPRYLAKTRMANGKDADYWHFHTLVGPKLGDKFDGIYFSGASVTWPEDFFSMPSVRAYYENLLKDEISLYMFQQFIAEKQFVELTTEAENLGVVLVADIPISVAEDSSFVIEDRMQNTNIYYLKDGFAEWTIGTHDANWGIIAYQNNDAAINHILMRYEKLAGLGINAFRIDAILQFVESWIIHRDSVPSNGRIERFNGYEFFRRLREKYPNALLISEDLSDKEMPYSVRDIQKKYNILGMGIFTYMEANGFENDVMRINYYGINVVIHSTNHDTGSLVKYAKNNWYHLSSRYSSYKNFVMDSIWRVCSCENEYVVLNILDLMLLDEDFQSDTSDRWTVRIKLEDMDWEMRNWIKNDALRLTGRSNN